jgi:serine/threonine protein kinase
VIQNCSPNAIDLLEKMLAMNPAKRWSCAEILLHPYFTEDNKHLNDNNSDNND